MKSELTYVHFHILQKLKECSYLVFLALIY